MHRCNPRSAAYAQPLTFDLTPQVLIVDLTPKLARYRQTQRGENPVGMTLVKPGYMLCRM